MFYVKPYSRTRQMGCFKKKSTFTDVFVKYFAAKKPDESLKDKKSFDFASSRA